MTIRVSLALHVFETALDCTKRGENQHLRAVLEQHGQRFFSMQPLRRLEVLAPSKLNAAVIAIDCPSRRVLRLQMCFTYVRVPGMQG
jgi:hypothetical protein